ncbi:MAG: VWA-like domain-containing protein [Byssovorax sp.]
MSSPQKSELATFLEGFTHDPGFLARYPHYTAILARLSPVADPSVSRMAVSFENGRYYLHVNVDSFVAEPHYLRGVLLHEVHHIVLGHLSHPKFTDAAEPELMDLALEMSANEHIEEPLPNPIVWRAYAQAGIRAGQSTMERYHKLSLALKSGAYKARPVPGIGQDRADDHRFLRSPARDPGAVEQTRQLLEKVNEEVKEKLRGDKSAPAPLLYGTTPGRLIEALTGVSREVEITLDWKVALRMFVARARAPVHTYARPNRRFPGRVGEVPGRSYSPRAIVRPHLLVAIDTSLSMTAAELAEIARQLAKMAEHARLTVAECDTEITRVYPFQGIIEEVEGRGGTDLRPVFTPDFLGTQKVEGVVYFTDGEGPYPTEVPRVPVLWVLTKATAFACPFGEKARLERKRR